MTNEVVTQIDVEVYDLLRQPYARVIIPEEDGSYRGEIMEFPGCIAVGDDASSALETLEDVARGWLFSALENGQPIPRPIELDTDYSGRLALRIPKSLHKKAAWYAAREGVSLNQFIVYSLAEAVGERRPTTTMFVNIYSTGPQISFDTTRGSTFNLVPNMTYLSAPMNRIGGWNARDQ